MMSLLNITGCRNKGELNRALPIYSKMTKVSKSARIGLFQAAVDHLLDEHKIKGFPCMVTLSMFSNMLSMKRDELTVELVLTGWLGNPRLFGPRDEETTNNLNIRVVSLLDGQTAASDQDTQAIIKMVFIPPVGDNSIDHVNMMEPAATICFLIGHTVLIWSHLNIAKFESL